MPAQLDPRGGGVAFADGQRQRGRDRVATPRLVRRRDPIGRLAFARLGQEHHRRHRGQVAHARRRLQVRHQPGERIGVDDPQQRADLLRARFIELEGQRLQAREPNAITKPARHRGRVGRHHVLPGQGPAQHPTTERDAVTLAGIVGQARAGRPGRDVIGESVAEHGDLADRAAGRLRVQHEVRSARHRDLGTGQLHLGAQEPRASADRQVPGALVLALPGAAAVADPLRQRRDEPLLELALEDRALVHRADAVDSL